MSLIEEQFGPVWDEIMDPLAAGRLRLIKADPLEIERTHWLWEDRLPLGTIGLLAGPGGAGKSTASYWLGAQLTRGTLPGELLGQPRAVIICSAEEGWRQVSLPRLLAAGADPEMIYRLEATGGDLSLPADMSELRALAGRVDAALVILDPLISRLGKLDTHKDAETRQALQPLAALAEEMELAIIGLIHFNKSASPDVIGQIMGSGAFANVARSVHVVIPDPDDDQRQRRLLGTPKNNYGRTDLPTLAFRIASEIVGADRRDGSPVSASRIEWLADSELGLEEAFYASREAGAGTQIGEAKDFLRQLLAENGGCVTSQQAKTAARREGLSERTLKRAAKSLRLLVESVPGSFPRLTTWTLPGSVSSEKAPADG